MGDVLGVRLKVVPLQPRPPCWRGLWDGYDFSVARGLLFGFSTAKHNSIFATSFETAMYVPWLDMS